MAGRRYFHDCWEQIKRSKGESRGVTEAICLDFAQARVDPRVRGAHVDDTDRCERASKLCVGVPARRRKATHRHNRETVACQSRGLHHEMASAKRPDLKWIENVWKIVSCRVRKRGNLIIVNFEQAIHEEWESFPQSRIQLHPLQAARVHSQGEWIA